DFDDLDQYEMAGVALNPPPKPANRFTQVTEDERRAHRWQIPWEMQEGIWVKIASAAGLLALLVIFALIAWRMMQPESADQIYQRIESAASESDTDRLVD